MVWLRQQGDCSRNHIGLTASQGQLVTSDGGARQSNDADLGPEGVLQKAAEKATGGVSTFKTSLERIK